MCHGRWGHRDLAPTWGASPIAAHCSHSCGHTAFSLVLGHTTHGLLPLPGMLCPMQGHGYFLISSPVCIILACHRLSETSPDHLIYKCVLSPSPHSPLLLLGPKVPFLHCNTPVISLNTACVLIVRLPQENISPGGQKALITTLSKQKTVLGEAREVAAE